MNHTKTNPAKNILAICVGFALLYYFTRWEWTLLVVVIIGGLSILSDWVTEKISDAWMWLAKVLALIVPNILLSLVFFLILTPLSFVSKLFGKKNSLKLKNPPESTFTEVDKAFEPASFEKLW
ncbi:MAG: hypothetical protein AAF990_21355 [Bacteroidota bacterium]